MSSETGDFRLVNLSNLPSKSGVFTVQLLRRITDAQMVSAREASSALLDLDNSPFFNERLSSYIAKRAGIEDNPREIKAFLRRQSEKKQLGISSANLSQWLPKDGKREYYLAPKTIFKLCLACDLTLEESSDFVYSCLHQNWFNYRDAEELIYCYYIAMQNVYGDESYVRATKMADRIKETILNDAKTEFAHADDLRGNATGYTRIIENDLGQMIADNDGSPDETEARLEEYLISNSSLFTGVKKSSIRQYRTFFEEGGIGIKPLRALYSEAEGLTLPTTSYLDMRDTRTNSSFEQDSDRRRKRLLWGAEFRGDWLARNDKDWDILHEREIKIERHDIEKFPERGVPRGNLVALLFFHFCYENVDELKSGNPRFQLFSKFYDTTNLLLDECGMTPLHPRKMLDSLFLRSLAHSGKANPIDYLNETLRAFYER